MGNEPFSLQLITRGRTAADTKAANIRSSGRHARVVHWVRNGRPVAHGVFVGNFNRPPPSPIRSPIPPLRIPTYSYNRVQIPWRRFEGGGLDGAFDVVGLTDWLRTQPGYDPSRTWQENLAVIGGADAMNTLRAIQSPEVAAAHMEKQANLDNQSKLDFEEAFRFGVQGINPDEGDTTAGPEWVDEEVEFDFSAEIDALLKAVDDPPDDDDEISSAQQLGDLFDEIFDEGFTDWDAMQDADSTHKQKKKIQKTLEKAAEGQAVQKAAEGPRPLDELGSLLDEAFASAVFGEEDEIVNLRGEIIKRPAPQEWSEYQTEQQQAGLGAGAPRPPSLGGYWTWKPSPGTTVEHRAAYIVADGTGSVHAVLEYDSMDAADDYNALNDAYEDAKAASLSDPWRTEHYAEYQKPAPGVAVMKAIVSVDEDGDWIGYEVEGIDEHGILDEASYRLYLDGEDVLEFPTDFYGKWVLPAWVPQSALSPGSKQARERYDFLADPNQAAEHVSLQRVEAARVGGERSPERLLDVFDSARYQVRIGDEENLLHAGVWHPNEGAAHRELMGILTNLPPGSADIEDAGASVWRTHSEGGIPSPEDAKKYGAIIRTPDGTWEQRTVLDDIGQTPSDYSSEKWRAAVQANARGERFDSEAYDAENLPEDWGDL
jgi:hypothetical protein